MDVENLHQEITLSTISYKKLYLAYIGNYGLQKSCVILHKKRGLWKMQRLIENYLSTIKKSHIVEECFLLSTKSASLSIDIKCSVPCIHSFQLLTIVFTFICVQFILLFSSLDMAR